MKILLVRHGESERNVGMNCNKDSPLTEKGEKQAEFLGKSLRKQKIDIDSIYSSNLKRSKKTAKIISQITKIPIKKNSEGLDEYPSKYLRRKLSASFNSRVRQLKKFLKDISKDKEKDKTILIVAHGITNRIIIGYFLEIPLRKQLLRFKQHNTGLNILEWSEKYKNWRLEFLNDINHLPEVLK